MKKISFLFNRTFALTLILIIAISSLTVLTVKPASAQTIVKAEIPKPAVPQFSVALYDSSYDIPASTSIDPFNGQQTTLPATHHDARTLVFTFQNQEFTPFTLTDINNNVYDVQFYFNIRWKGHFGQDWNVLFGPHYGYIKPTSGPQTIYVANGSFSQQEFDVVQWSVSFPAYAQIDFQVEALTGYPTTPTIFTGQESGWSNTQTVTLNETVTSLPSVFPQIYNSPLPSTSPMQTPESTPTVPELSWLAVLPLLSLFFVAVIIRQRKTANVNQ